MPVICSARLRGPLCKVFGRFPRAFPIENDFFSWLSSVFIGKGCAAFDLCFFGAVLKAVAARMVALGDPTGAAEYQCIAVPDDALAA
eukprot:3378987-Pleurochrysis_carterae.AAC.1